MLPRYCKAVTSAWRTLRTWVLARRRSSTTSRREMFHTHADTMSRARPNWAVNTPSKTSETAISTASGTNTTSEMRPWLTSMDRNA